MNAARQIIQPNRTVGQYLPYLHHVTDRIIETKAGDYVRIWKVEGADMTTATAGYKEAAKDQLATLYKSIKNVDIWQHTIRRETKLRCPSVFKNEACRVYNDNYISTFDKSFVTDIYLTVVFKAGSSKKVKALTSIGRPSKALIDRQKRQDIGDLNDIGDQLETSLAGYGIKALGRRGKFSEPREFLHQLATVEKSPQRYPVGPLAGVISNARTRVGNDFVEIETLGGTRYAKIIELDDYPEDTEPGEFDPLMQERYEFVITQSFSPMNKVHGGETLRRQLAHLKSTGDRGQTQVTQIEAEGGAMDQVAVDRLVMGEYCYTMTIYSDKGLTGEEAKLNCRDHVKSAYAMLTNMGYAPSLSHMATDAAWYSQFPAMKKERPQIHNLTSRNFASLACLHGFAHGKDRGNPWGEYWTVMQSVSGYPYRVNLHLDDNPDDQRGELLSGSTSIIGSTGAGKTVFAQHLFAQANKYDATLVMLDKDYGAKAAIEARGGLYLGLECGLPTGIAPFQWEPTPSNIAFIESLVARLAGGLSRSEETRVAMAIRTVMTELVLEDRSLSAMLQNVTEGHDADNSVVTRLAKWCRDDGTGRCGAYWWVIDNEVDSFNLTGSKDVGIDVTDFIDNDVVCGPLTMVLLHKVISLMGDGPFVFGMDEFSRLIDDPVIRMTIKDQLKTIRKKRGLCLMMSQSPSDILESDIAASIVEQSATKIFLPNPEADEAEYTEGFKLTIEEYDLIRGFALQSHKMLIKQGQRSQVLQLNLNGVEGARVVGL